MAKLAESTRSSSADEPAAQRSWSAFEKVFAQRNVANNAPHLIPYIQPNSRIIDVGCGIGSITIDFAQRAPNGFVVGIDHSEESIATAKQAAANLNLTNIHFLVGDIQDGEIFHQYSPDSFDIAHAHQVLLHLPSPVPVLQHLHRLSPLVATRDNAFLHFHPSGPTMTLNMQRFIATGPGEIIGAGKVHHVWMHAAGFAWSEIQTGVAGQNVVDDDFKRAGAEGYVSIAAQRGEGEEFLRALREEWEVFMKDPGGRALSMDSWCIGRRSEGS